MDKFIALGYTVKMSSISEGSSSRGRGRGRQISTLDEIANRMAILNAADNAPSTIVSGYSEIEGSVIEKSHVSTNVPSSVTGVSRMTKTTLLSKVSELSSFEKEMLRIRQNHREKHKLRQISAENVRSAEGLKFDWRSKTAPLSKNDTPVKVYFQI